MQNLLKETIEDLKDNGKTPSDVLWAGNREFYTTWDHFSKIANVNYDAGFGSQKIASDLLIIGEDWYMERHEYDGSEGWEFKQVIKRPEKRFDFLNVAGGMWNSLEKLNDREGN